MKHIRPSAGQLRSAREYRARHPQIRVLGKVYRVVALPAPNIEAAAYGKPAPGGGWTFDCPPEVIRPLGLEDE